MAKAWLAASHDPGSIDTTGKTVWWVSADINQQPPFSGNVGRTWSNFQCADGEAMYEWKSRDDVIRETGRAFAEGRISLEQATSVDEVRDWLETHCDRIDSYLEEEGQADDLPENDRLSIALAELATKVPGEWNRLSAYHEEDDRQLEDAARALDLPSWAKVLTGEEGGVGASYLQAFIVMDEGRTLVDLAAWLASQRGGGGP